jgi:two-component system, chemotaxis family, sensor kinase CheA
MPDELLADFLAETTEGLAEADVALLRLERAPGDQATLAVVFRAIHSIKGTCGFLPLPRLGQVAHAAEEVLGRVRDGGRAVTPVLVTVMLAALDCIRQIVNDIAVAGQEPPGDDSALIAALGALARGKALPPRLEDCPASVTEPGEHHPEDPAAQTVRVGVDVIETLMTLVSELVLTRNQLIQLARTQEDSRFSAPLQRLSLITSDLQEEVMRTRMQPVGQLVNKLTRLTRDLGQELGKRIDLVMTGQETELDRQVLEMMRDPLTHMVRNSADHGLEDPVTRRNTGKPETGTITLHAYHEAGHAVIEIGDDGTGLPTDRIRAQALARGLATAAELERMTDRQIQAFILQPGFTTATAVTAVSGRGVGMDVVRSNIARIGGTIDLQSTAGVGTLFTIKIPLTLAIISAFIVQTRGERFALPQISVIEVVRIDGRAGGPTIEHSDAVPMLRLRKRLVPLVQLGDLLRLGPAAANAGSVIVVAAVGSLTLGIVVDQVFDTEEIVVKPVAPLLRHIALFGGATILGDGSVIMILDPNAIARTMGLSGSAEARPRTPPVRDKAEPSGDNPAMLLFRTMAGAAPSAVPLHLVARIETMACSQITTSGDRYVALYHGKLIPLIAIDPARQPNGRTVTMLIFAEQDRSMGLIVHEVVEVVEERLVIEPTAERPGLLGTAMIAGRVTDVIDTMYWLAQAWQDWFHDVAHSPGIARQRVLVVENSAFFRQLLVPMLTAAGYQVTAVESASRALKLRDSPLNRFDAIISGVEMPDMDGLTFARHLRAGGAWQATPLLALTAHLTEADAGSIRAAGFSESVPKLDRETLLAGLRRCVNQGSQASV